MKINDLFLNDSDNEFKYVLDKDIVYGKDYPSGYVDWDLYRVLNCMENGHDLDSILFRLNFNSSLSIEMIKDVLINQNLIESIGSDNTIDIKEEISKLNASELSNLLKKYNIPVSGKKKKLMKLAIQNIPEHEFADVNYKISSEGEEFLKDYEWMKLYGFALYNFEFNEFYKYLDENDGNFIDLAFDYIAKHFKIAGALKDFLYYDACQDAWAQIYTFKKDFTNGLTEELKRFILRLNPKYYSYHEYYALYLVFEYNNIENIEYLLSKLDISNIEDEFFRTWDSMEIENVYVSCEDSLNYLKKLLNHADLNYLSEECYKKYFDTPEEIFKIGIYYYSSHQYEAAIDFFDFVLEEDPNNIDALLYQADSFYSLKQYDEALKSVEEALEIDSNNPSALSSKGMIIGENDIESAQVYFDKALSFNPNNFEVLWDIAEFYSTHGDYDKALEYYDHVCSLNEDKMTPFVEKAQVYIKLNDYDNADKVFDEIHEKFGDSLDYFNEKASYLMYKKDYEKSLEFWNKSIKLDNNEYKSLLARSFVLSKLGRDEDSQNDFDKALEIYPIISKSSREELFSLFSNLDLNKY